MADYDLGTAHGRIVIESDNRGSADAAKSLSQIEAAAQTLNRAFSNTERAMGQFSESVQNVRQRVQEADTRVRSFGSTVAGIVGSVQNASANVQKLASDLQQFGSQALEAGRRIDDLHGKIERLSTARGVVSSLTGSLLGLDKATQNLPHWAQQVLDLNRAFAGLRLASGVLTGVGARITAVAASSAAFAAISPRVATFNNAIRGAAATAALLVPRLSVVGDAVRNMGVRLGLAGQALEEFGRSALRGITGVSQIITGGALVARSLDGIGRAAKIAALALAGLSVAGAGMSALGTIVMGLWDALSQLSGLVGLMPGAILGLGIAVGTAKLAFSGLKDAAKAAFGDAEKFDKAIADMTPTMQGVAKALRDVKPQLQGLQNAAQSAALAGLGNDIKVLSNLYLPQLRGNLQQTGSALNNVKNAIRDALLTPSVNNNVNQSFTETSRIINNLSRAIQPAIRAFTDLGVVGLQALGDLTTNLGSLVERFANFIQHARETGQLRGWIDDAVQGVRDLGTTLKATGQIIETVFRAFGVNGDDALAKLAKGAEHFRDVVQQSARGGGLETIASTLKRMADTSMDVLSAALTEVTRLLRTLAPIAEEISSTFSGSLVVIIQDLGAAFNLLASAIAHVPALGSLIGSLLAMGVALKGMALLFNPIVRGFQLIAGTVTVVRGVVTALGSLSAAMTTAAGRSELLAAAQTKLQGVSSATAAATALTATLVAATSVYLIAQAGIANLEAGYKEMAEGTKIATESVRGFTTAFSEANGVMAKSVTDEGVTQVDKLKQHFQELADKSPGWKESFADLRVTLSSPIPVHTEQFQKLQAASDDAKAFNNSLAKLQLTTQDVASAITGSNGAWTDLNNRLSALGAEGVRAVDMLYPLRQAFVDTQQAMAKVGPGGVQLTNALKQIADAGDNTSQKLEGLKAALQGLGLIQQTAQQAAFDYQEALRQIGTSAQTAADSTQPLGQALLTASGQLDATKQNAFNLHQQLQSLADKFLESAAKGGNAQQMWTDMQPALEQLASAFGLPVPKIQELIQQMGVVPSVVTTIMSVQGADDVKQNLVEVLLRAQQVNGTPITVQVNSQQAITALEQLGAKVSVYDEKTHTATLTLDPTLANAALAQLQQQAANTKIPAPKVEQPQSPPPAPPPPGQEQPIPAPKVETPQTPPPAPPPVQPGVLPAPQVEVPQTPIPAPPPPAPPIPAPPVEVPKVPELPPLPQYPPIALQITGVENVTGALANIGGAINDSQGKWAGYGQAIQTAMQAATQAIQGFANSVGPALSGMADTARNSGAALGQGFADGINSKVDAVRQAALNLANAAAAPLPRSPALIGPFSGSGWTPFRGRKLALGFAEGIQDGTTDVQAAALDMAVATAAAMDQVRATLGVAQTSFAANRKPGAGNALFYRDPNISDAQLAENRQKKAQEKAQKDRDDAFREQKKQNEKVLKFNQNLEVKQDKNGKKALLAADKDNKDLVGAMTKVANAFGLELTSGVREGDPGFHGSGHAADFSNGVGTDQELAFARFVEQNFKPFTKELIFQDPRFAGNEIKNGQNVPASFYANSGDKNDHVHWAVDVAPVLVGPVGDIIKQNLPSKKEQQKQTDSTNSAIKAGSNNTSQSQQEIVDTIVAEGKRQGLSDEEIASGVATGIVESNLRNVPGGDRDSVGVFQQRNFDEWTKGGARDRMNVGDAARSYFEHLKQTDPSLSPGERAQMVQRSAFPDKYGQAMLEAQRLTQESLQRQGDTVDLLGSSNRSLSGIYDGIDDTRSEQEKSLDELRKNNKTIDNAIKVAQNPNSSDEEVIRALQDIHDGIAVTEDPDAREGLKAVESAVMEDRGIKQYDPFEGASKDPISDTIKIAQGVIGLFDTIKGGLDSATQVADILVRGISNTDDINKVIDGVQGVVQAFTSVVSTVTDIVSTVASLAALAGAAIPGIGQVAAVASVVTGGIGNVNAVVDMVQEVFKIGGWLFGNVLSALAGGENGPLSGDVHVLLDSNDNTIKTWSTENPEDKRIHPLGPTPSNSTTNNNAPQNLNVFAGPGTDPHQMMNEAMFAIRSSQQGVY